MSLDKCMEWDRHNWARIVGFVDCRDVPRLFSKLRSTSESDAGKVVESIASVACCVEVISEASVPIAACIVASIDKYAPGTQYLLLSLLFDILNGEPDKSIVSRSRDILSESNIEASFGLVKLLNLMMVAEDRVAEMIADVLVLMCHFNHQIVPRVLWYVEKVLIRSTDHRYCAALNLVMKEIQDIN